MLEITLSHPLLTDMKLDQTPATSCSANAGAVCGFVPDDGLNGSYVFNADSHEARERFVTNDFLISLRGR